MSKVTVKKNKNFTIISNIIFKDTRLSFKAKGLLTTMLSCPDDWNYTIEGLTKLSKDGKASIRSALSELEEHGYLERKQLRDEKGTFTDTEYIVYEQPMSDFRKTDKPISDKCTQLNTIKIKNLKNKETYNSPSSMRESDFDLEIMQKVTELTENDAIIDGIQYYLDTYRRYMNKRHPNVSKPALKDIIHNIETVLQDEWEDVVNEDGLIRMITRHFKTDYGEFIDYNLVHFGTEKILYYQARNVGLITGIID